jgi:hypothetical protein
VSDESGGERPKLPKTTHIVLYLLIVGAALGGWIWYSTRALAPETKPAATTGARPATTAAPATAPPAAPATAVADVPGDGFGVVAGLATPWAVPGGPGEPTPTPPPATPAPAAAPIALLGPPAGSFYRQSDLIAFYWSSPEPLAAGQQFTVYLLVGDAQVALGSVDNANLGQGYQVQAIPGQNVEEPGRISWLVAIEEQATGAIIGQSEARAITLIADN